MYGRIAVLRMAVPVLCMAVSILQYVWKNRLRTLVPVQLPTYGNTCHMHGRIAVLYMAVPVLCTEWVSVLCMAAPILCNVGICPMYGGTCPIYCMVE
jgi:hypothetical protein